MSDLTFWTMLVLSSPILWVLACIVWGLLVWTIKEEQGVIALIIVAVFFTAYTFLGSGMEILEWIAENPWDFIYLALGYVGIGILWATFYWWFPFCHGRLDEYNALKREWLEKIKPAEVTTDIPEDKKQEWLIYLYHIYAEKEKYRWAKTDLEGTIISLVKPRTWTFKTDIVRWLSAWPVSMFWWLCHGVIVGFWKWLQKTLSGFYNWIADRVFHNIENDWK
jgi:hypothetical protein